MYRYCVFSLSLAVSLSHTLTNMQNTSLWTGLNWPVSIFSLCFNAWTATGDKSGTLHHAPSVVSWQVICSDVALTPHDLPTKQTQQRWRWCLTLRAFGINARAVFYSKARMDSTCPVSHCCVFSALCHILIAIACVSFILLLLLTTAHSYLFNRILFRRSNVFEAMWTLTGSTYGLTLAWSWTLNIASPILNQG